MRRVQLESEIQRQILAALGSEPDFLIFKNAVGVATNYDAEGKPRKHPFGLGVGSPDLVGIFRMTTQFDGIVMPQRLGLWLCMEVKVPGEDATDEQKKCHEVWRSFGAIVEVVHSVDEARDVLEGVRAQVSLV